MFAESLCGAYGDLRVGVLPRVQRVSRRVGRGVHVEVDNTLWERRPAQIGAAAQLQEQPVPSAEEYRQTDGRRPDRPRRERRYPDPVVVRRPRSDASPNATWRSVGPF
jgi:hypothetical protein